MSRSIRWSYPAFSNEQVVWQEAAAVLDPQGLPYQFVYEGFSAIVIDRYGYGDNGAAATAAIHSGLRDQKTLAKADRYIALDIRSIANAPEVATSPLPIRLTAATPAMGPCGSPALMSVDQIGGAF